MFRRQFVTKYFDDNARPFVERGCFRFGTLKKYRDEEGNATEFRLRDTGEGKSVVGLFPKDGKIDFLQLPGGGTIINGSFTDGAPGSIPIAYENVINDYVCCTTIGDYSPEHHRIMRYGIKNSCGEIYGGDVNLKNFAVIDVEKFKAALECVLKNHPVWTTKLRIEQALGGLPVKYGERDQKKDVASNYRISETDRSMDYLNSVFRKPTKYSPEREFRFLIRPCAPACIGDVIEPLDLQSKLLRRSIVKLGP